MVVDNRLTWLLVLIAVVGVGAKFYLTDDTKEINEVNPMLPTDVCKYKRYARKYKTDDFGRFFAKEAFYKPFEEMCLKHRWKSNFTLVEFGRHIGASTWLFHEMFPNALIVSVDTREWLDYWWLWWGYKKPSKKDRIVLIQGAQTDDKILKRICDQYKNIDIVVDDAGHRNEDVLKTFETMFPCLRSGGTYVIEDIQTSYFPKFNGSCDPTKPRTIVNYFKSMIDQQQYVMIPKKNNTYLRKQHALSDWLQAIHFYLDLLIVDKGPNPGNTTKYFKAPYNDAC